MVSSTPGGIEIGVRPSFEGLAVDAENCRRAAGAGAQFWKAGTRKEGSVTTDEGAKALALLGASIGGLATGCGSGQLHRASVACSEAERDHGPWAYSSKIPAGRLRKRAGTTAKPRPGMLKRLSQTSNPRSSDEPVTDFTHSLALPILTQLNSGWPTRH